MKYQIPENLVVLANKASKIRFVKKLLKPLYYPYKNYMQKQRKKFFISHAKEVLAQFDTALKNGNYYYTLAFGTMLGAVREKGFIKHDLDIDVFMWNEDWSPTLEKSLNENGFKILHRHLVDNGESGREETYIKDNISIDIFFLYPSIDKYPYCCDFLSFPDTATSKQSMMKHGGLIVRRIELPIERERILTNFEGLQLYIPKNFKEILTFRYGPDYMTPNSNWTIKSYDNHIVVWKEKIGILTK